MVYEKTYQFDDLEIDSQILFSLLGYPNGDLPEPFDSYLAEGLEEAAKICQVKGAYVISENVRISSGKIEVDGVEFNIGRRIARELKNSQGVAFIICTAGEQISKRSKQLMAGENPVLGYVFDLIGSQIAESAADRLQNELAQLFDSDGLKITNRYSPGYCDWNVAEQHQLFSFFPEGCCGIRLTESALMDPVKSVSGIIGWGPDVSFRNYMCDLCGKEDCLQRIFLRRTSGE